jgi:two-component system response regulator HydG
LRTLQSGEYEPVGSGERLKSEFRLLAATSGDLEASIAAGRLRVDLVHRLGALRVVIPPLRQRLDDIPLLVDTFLAAYGTKRGDGPVRFTPEALALLMQFAWPGNVRQLRNVVEAGATMAGDDEDVDLCHVLPILEPAARGDASCGCVTLAEARRRAEEEAIGRALAQADGNREEAAKLLRISAATLYRKLKDRRRQTA